MLESVAAPKPLGVGINLQPNAVRELYELGIGPAMLDTIGLPAKEWALVGLNGDDVYSEPRGLLAGYKWPQYAVHRGQLQMLLLGADGLHSAVRALRCIPTSGRSNGAAQLCGAARRPECRSARAPRSSGSARIGTAWSSIRFRDPIRWVSGRVALLGDAAHVM